MTDLHKHPHPNLYATFHCADDDEIILLRNDEGQEFTITKEAAGDIALMMADWCKDPDLAEMVADTWRGQADDLREFPDGDYDDEPEDETKVDLGGGMVVPLAELLEDE